MKLLSNSWLILKRIAARQSSIGVATLGLFVVQSAGAATISGQTFTSGATLGSVDINNTATSRYNDLVGAWIGNVDLSAALSGNITVTNGSTTDYYAQRSMTGVLIDGTQTSSSILNFADLTIGLTAYGAGASSTYKDAMFGVSGKHTGAIAFSNTQININYADDRTWSEAHGISLLSAIDSFDATSKITISNDNLNLSSTGLSAQSIRDFSGTIEVTSGFAYGMQIHEGVADANIAGSITLNAHHSAIGIAYDGKADTISTNINITRTNTVGGSTIRGIYLQEYSGGWEDYSEVLEISSDITITTTNNVRGLEVDEMSWLTKFSGNIDVSTSSGELIGILNEGSIEEIAGTIKLNNTYNDAESFKNTAAVVQNLSFDFTMTEHGSTSFVTAAFSGNIEATGLGVAVGLHLNYWTQQKIDKLWLPEGTIIDSANKSGLITGSISANTTEGTTRIGATGILTEAERNLKHYKTTAAIRVSSSDIWLSSLNPVTEGQNAVLNFGNGARVSSTVGAGESASYGDAIQFNTHTLALNAGADDTVEIIGDITSVTANLQYEGAISGMSGIETPPSYVEPEPTPAEIEEAPDPGNTPVQTPATREVVVNSALDSIGQKEDALQFIQGKYNVSSEFWFVSEVTVGSHVNLSVSTINLHDSTKFADTDTLNFHVNSIANYSSININGSETLTITEMDTVNITLGAELMATETFRLTLIDGEMIDLMGGFLTVNLFDLITEGTGGLVDDLASIYVEYDGEVLFYKDGPVSFAYKGNATDLIIGREAIPEPSTATLSLLALAGLLARRRRKAA